ncbi:MAG TPA: MauE/DoxX family redox-associated membrane protein [Candidatus Acidoferrales bacterium]|nr:MauE/DoxX family redox-associated membrane protein [Candidatus Acidoferrales bacterium]
MDFSKNKALRIVLLTLRVVLGAIFVYAGYVKLKDPWQLFAAGVASYDLLPMGAVEVVARTLPWFEVAVGVVLITGFFFRTSSTIITGLLAVFFTLIVRAYMQGKEINCGCFGGNEPISPLTMLRDGSMLAGAIFLCVMAYRSRRTPA